MPNATVLIVDDEKNILTSLEQALQLEGYRAVTAATAERGFAEATSQPIDAVLLDVKLPDGDGLEVLGRILAARPGIPVVMMSGHGTIDTAVKATQRGASDFLEKPISRERLLLSLQNALTHVAALSELEALKKETGASLGMVGDSEPLRRLMALIEKAAPSEGRVLITGENGTGKELVARAIHQRSRRKQAPFIKLNCAAVPAELIESELFGHEKGAFTGAVSARKGKFEQAHTGTLFLDEVGDMPLSMQAKLLRVLQEGELERVGGTETLRVDVRVIAATNKDLEREVKAGRFREDLYFRLNVVHLHTPALRERPGDLPQLVTAFLGELCEKNGKRPMRIVADLATLFGSYEFPGNVRELKNLIERVVILCDGPTVSAAEVVALLPPRRSGGAAATSIEASAPQSPSPSPAAIAPGPVYRFQVGKRFHEQVEEAEREIILGALAHARDNATEAARVLELERGHFYKKMKALGIKRAGGETSVEG